MFYPWQMIPFYLDLIDTCISSRQEVFMKIIKTHISLTIKLKENCFYQTVISSLVLMLTEKYEVSCDHFSKTLRPVSFMTVRQELGCGGWLIVEIHLPKIGPLTFCCYGKRKVKMYAFLSSKYFNKMCSYCLSKLLKASPVTALFFLWQIMYWHLIFSVKKN